VTPKRIQRQRTKGWRMPPGAVYVGRPSRWGNPFIVGDGPLTFHGYEQGEVGRGTEGGGRADLQLPDEFGLTPAMAAALYRDCLLAVLAEVDNERVHPQDRARSSEIAAALAKLRGRDLCCWCPLDQACHADVLLELANS